jgi:hypothetical protein
MTLSLPPVSHRRKAFEHPAVRILQKTTRFLILTTLLCPEWLERHSCSKEPWRHAACAGLLLATLADQDTCESVRHAQSLSA